MALEQPGGGQVRGADQARFVGMVADRLDVDRDGFGLEDDPGPGDRQFANAAFAQSAPDYDPFGALPRLELEEAADDVGQLLGKILDRALNHGDGFGIALFQQGIEGLLADLVAGLVAERVFARLAQRFSPFLEDVAKRSLAGAIAEEAILVLQFGIVAVDLDRRQTGGTVGGEGSLCSRLFGHKRLVKALYNGASRGKFHHWLGRLQGAEHRGLGSPGRMTRTVRILYYRVPPARLQTTAGTSCHDFRNKPRTSVLSSLVDTGKPQLRQVPTGGQICIRPSTGSLPVRSASLLLRLRRSPGLRMRRRCACAGKSKRSTATCSWSRIARAKR